MYRKRPESRSTWTKSGHGHGGSNRCAQVSCNRPGSGNPVPGSPPLNISSSPMANNGRWVSTDFLPKEKLGFLFWRRRERKSVPRLSPSTGAEADSARMDLIDLGHGLVQSLFKTYQQELEVSLAS